MIMSEWDIMIKFEGQLCEQVETRVVKKIRIFTLICSIFVSTIMCTLFIYIGYTSGLLYPFAICALVAIAYVIFMIVYCCLPCSRKDNLPACPTKIVIDDDYIAIYLRIGAYKRRDLYDVKKVIDYGVFYDIKFYFPWEQEYMCQKDLIVEGTIEEFEELFADKLVRKTPKEKE